MSFDDAGVMYTSTHSKRSSVGRVGESRGWDGSVRSGARVSDGVRRRSVPRRWYTGEWTPVPPLAVG